MGQKDKTCAECGGEVSRPAVRRHRGAAEDLVFCSSACHTDWSLDRASDIIRMKMEGDL